MRKLNVLVYNDISASLLDFLNTYYQTKVICRNHGNIDYSTIDLIICHGEQRGDLNPDYYGEAKAPQTNVLELGWSNYRRLITDGRLRSIPVLGIGDGAHQITVTAGGSLIQHVTKHDTSHGISTVYTPTTAILAPSQHHQMMYPFDLPKHRFELLAWSTYYLSDTYITGSKGEKELAEEFLEPEIVVYDGSMLAIQGNPALGTQDYKKLCKNLIDNLLKGRFKDVK
jgi:hypothetical protein